MLSRNGTKTGQVDLGCRIWDCGFRFVRSLKATGQIHNPKLAIPVYPVIPVKIFSGMLMLPFAPLLTRGLLTRRPLSNPKSAMLPFTPLLTRGLLTRRPLSNPKSQIPNRTPLLLHPTYKSPAAAEFAYREYQLIFTFFQGQVDSVVLGVHYPEERRGRGNSGRCGRGRGSSRSKIG